MRARHCDMNPHDRQFSRTVAGLPESRVMTEKWFSRNFRFDIPAARFSIIVDRLRGAPARAEEKLRACSAEFARRRVDGTWSPQENVAHLEDLEALHLLRLDELEAGRETLTPADVKNTKTWEARHNERSVADVLRAFRATRERLLARLEGWDPARLETYAMHPRLKTPMRVVDLAYFVAEHDDSHLARV